MTRRRERVGVGLLIAGLWVHPGVAWPLGWLGAHTGARHTRHAHRTCHRTCGAHARRDRPACGADGTISREWRGREQGLRSVGDWWEGLSQIGPPWRGAALPSLGATADRQQHDRGGLPPSDGDRSGHSAREGRGRGWGLDGYDDRIPRLESCVSGGVGGEIDVLKGVWEMWSPANEKGGDLVPGWGSSERRAGGCVDPRDHHPHQQHVDRWLSVRGAEGEVGGAWKGRVRRKVMEQQLSPVAMTDMKEDPKPRSNNFTVNVGKAMDTLRVDVRLYFEREPELSIYTNDIVLRDDTRIYARGQTAYRLPFVALRTLTVFLPAAPVVDLLSLRWDEARQCIYVRFQVQIDTFWDTLYFDTVSLFRVNAQGLIYEHRIENVVRKDLMERPNVIVWRSMATRC